MQFSHFNIQDVHRFHSTDEEKIHVLVVILLTDDGLFMYVFSCRKNFAFPFS